MLIKSNRKISFERSSIDAVHVISSALVNSSVHLCSWVDFKFGFNGVIPYLPLMNLGSIKTPESKIVIQYFHSRSCSQNSTLHARMTCTNLQRKAIKTVQQLGNQYIQVLMILSTLQTSLGQLLEVHDYRIYSALNLAHELCMYVCQTCSKKVKGFSI